MDRHLNLFNSYSQGGHSNSKEIRVLEDNVTRALIICLNEINGFAIFFLEEFLSIKSTKKPNFDLQHLGGINKAIVNECPKKYFLGISPTGNDPYKKNISINNLDPEEKKEEEFNKELGSRADAWIWEVNKFIVLIENKIYGELYIEQINRHITDSKGLDKKEFEEINKIFISWKQIFNLITQFIKKNKKEKKIYLLNQFKEYLEMTSAVLDPFINRDNLQSRISYLRNLVSNIEKKISNDEMLSSYYPHLKNVGKYMSYVGFQLGNGEAHYNIAFNQNSLDINLTLFGAKINGKYENRRDLIMNYIKNTISKVAEYGNKNKLSQDQNLLIRYNIAIRGYRTYMKNESGDSFPTFGFHINLYEFVMKKNSFENKKKILEDFFKIYEQTRKFGISKQIDISYSLSIPDQKNTERMRKNNRYIDKDIRLLNEDVLIDLENVANNFVDFIKNTIEIAKVFGLEKKVKVAELKKE